MNKNILVKLAGIAAAVSLLVGGAYAAFTSNPATITGVVLSSATPTLQVYDNSSGWGDTANGAGLGITESNMYPGFVGAEHTFWLRNTSNASVPFGQIVANLPSAINDWEVLKDVVQMRFSESGVNWSTSWYTLNQWNSGSANILLSELPGGDTQRLFGVQFRMLSAGDGARGKTLTLTLKFVGMTPTP